VALAANYPFATIEPNVGIAEVPDARLAELAKIVNTTVLKSATVEFVDIAGLVKGASKGEGLGNKFLANIRNTSAVCHVLRAFENGDILREGTVAPAEDLAAIRLELQLADLETLTKQQQPKGSADKEALKRWSVVQELTGWVEAEKLLSTMWEADSSLREKTNKARSTSMCAAQINRTNAVNRIARLRRVIDSLGVFLSRRTEHRAVSLRDVARERPYHPEMFRVQLIEIDCNPQAPLELREELNEAQ
jgi:ribosome-binding ATPase YchF (GTP1/OBG family)